MLGRSQVTKRSAVHLMSKQKTGMDLTDFVRDVLYEIIYGVNEAAQKVRDAHTSELLRGVVNPHSNAETKDVEFDVALTVTTKGGAKLGVQVPFVGTGEGSAERLEQQTSRVRFSVPIAFASQPVGKEFVMTGPPGQPETYPK